MVRECEITWIMVGGYVNEVEGQVNEVRGHVARTRGDVNISHVDMAEFT